MALGSNYPGLIALTTVSASSPIVRPSFFQRAIEATWLVAAFLVPVLVIHERVMLGFIQMPKVFAFRSLAIVLIVFLVFEWAFTNRADGTSFNVRDMPVRAWHRLRAHPARMIVYAAISVLVANLLSLAFSPVRSIGIWGIDPGWDTYALYSIVSYLVFFSVIMTRLRSRSQINRLIWTLTAASVLVSVYGIAQHFGIDPFRVNPVPVERSGLTFGNPIFGAAYLILTVPLTVAVFMPYRDRMGSLTHIWIGAGLIGTQITAIIFTFSRGPWVAFVIGIIVLQVVGFIVYGKRDWLHSVSILLVAILIAIFMNLLPVTGAPPSNPSFGDRVATIAPDVAGGLNNRWTIWKTSAEVFFTTPWVDTDENPDIPELRLRWLRPFVGYGPEMFGYAYPLAGDTVYTRELASHGHNFIVHTALELGLFGVAAYLFLLSVVGIALTRLVRGARHQEYPMWFAYLTVAMSAVFVTRVVEQFPGKAQVADLHLMWILVAIVAVMVTIRTNIGVTLSDDAASSFTTSNRRRPRRSRRGSTSGHVATWSIQRLLFAFGVTLLAVVLWTQTVLNEFRGAFIARDAVNAIEQKRGDQGTNLYRQALIIAPSAPINRINLGQRYLELAVAGDKPLTERATLLQRALTVVKPVLERNPMDHRGWSRTGEFTRELALMAPNLKEDAIYRNQVLVNLMPGFWQARTALAFSLLRLDEFDQALEAVQGAKDARVLESKGAEMTYFIQASAFAGKGLPDQARAAAHCSLAYKPTTQVVELLSKLGEDVEGTKLKLTSIDFAICPELIPE